MESKAQIHYLNKKYYKREIKAAPQHNQVTIEKPWKFAPQFIKLPRVMLADKTLSSGAIHLATIMLTYDISSKDKRKHNKGEGIIWTGVDKLARAMRKSRQMVSIYLKELKMAGYIKRIPRHHSSDMSIMTFPIIETVEELIKRFNVFDIPINKNDFEFIASDTLKPDLDLLFNVIKEVREENKRNDSDKNPLTVSPKDLERYVLEWFNEDKNKPRPTVQPTSDKKVKPKHVKKVIEPKDQTATNYIKKFYINNAFHGIDTITKEQMNNFADAGNKCIEFFEQHKSKFNSYMGLHSPLEIAKLLCESIKSQVDDSMYQDWTKVTPGWFNSAKAFQRLMRYMDHQAMFTDNAITYQTYGVQEDYEERERKEQEEEAEFESEWESNW